MLVNVDGRQKCQPHFFFFNYNSVFDRCFTRPTVFFFFVCLVFNGNHFCMAFQA